MFEQGMDVSCSKAEEEKEIKVLPLGDEEIELPSTITDRLFIFMPRDKTTRDPRIYGKWMWFSNGDIYLQDQVWTKLQSLLGNKCVLLESSTAQNNYEGVIKCYTGQEKMEIFEAGLALQHIVNDKAPLFYKTDEASKCGLYRRSFDRFITKYMLTVNGRFYERDNLDRWKRIDDGSTTCEESLSCNQDMYFPPHKRQYYIDMEMLPSAENRKEKYVVGSHINRDYYEPVGMWHLFCDIIDSDSSDMTELDRNWIQVRSLFDEGVFIGAGVETNAYFYRSGDANYKRRSVTCDVKDYMDVRNVMETGLMLLKRCNYSFPIYMKSLRPIGRKTKFTLRYMLTEDGDLYNYVDEHWKFLKTS